MKKSYPLEIVLSLTTGVLLKKGAFGDLHELAEHVAGHAIWSHEFAQKALWEQLRDMVYVQHPRLREAAEYDKPDDVRIAEYLPAYVDKAVAQFGATVEIEGGHSERSESPVESLLRLAPDSTVVVVET